MPALAWTALAVAVTSLLVALGVSYLVWRLRDQVVEPIELRRQVLGFDQLLSEHSERLNAYYARQRKRDKSLARAFAPGPENGLGAPADEVVGVQDEPPTKESLRARARQRGLL